MNLFDIANEKSRLKELEEQTKENDFWNDQEKSAVVLQKIKILKDKVSNYDVLNGNLEDIHAMIELIEEANDESLIDELKQDVKKFEKDIPLSQGFLSKSFFLSFLRSAFHRFEACYSFLGWKGR